MGAHRTDGTLSALPVLAFGEERGWRGLAYPRSFHAGGRSEVRSGWVRFAVAFHAGGHVDKLPVASRADLRLHGAHRCFVLPLAILAGRALWRRDQAQP